MVSEQGSAQRACWVVRAGPGARDLDLFQRCGFVGLSTDLGGAVATEALQALAGHIIQRHPGMNRAKALGLAAMLHAFVFEMKIGDVVLTPAPGGSSLLVGAVTGEYRYAGESDKAYRHLRDVDWRSQPQLSAVPERARSGLRAPLTLFRPGAQELLLDSLGAIAR